MTSKSKRSLRHQRVADMSVPAEQRRRKRTVKGRGVKGRIAQMDHANHPEDNKRRREWERKTRKGRKKS